MIRQNKSFNFRSKNAYEATRYREIFTCIFLYLDVGGYAFFNIRLARKAKCVLYLAKLLALGIWGQQMGIFSACDLR